MKYSILVPVYNVESYINKCIESLINQSSKDYEIILVNDGSTDNSGLICDNFAKIYPETIRVYHKENEGILLTRRFSIKKAKGEYIIFVDSDDYVSDSLIETLNRVIAKHNSDMIIYNYIRFSNGSFDFIENCVPFKNETVFNKDNKIELYEEFILNHTFVNMWVKAIKRSVIDLEFNYKDWNVKRGEDIIQSFALFENSQKIVFVNEKLYYYRKNDGSETSKVNYDDYISFLLHHEITKKYMKNWGVSQGIKVKYYYRQMSKFYVYLRNLKKISKTEDSSIQYKRTLISLISDKSFIEICNNFTFTNNKLSLNIRLMMLKYLTLSRKIKLIDILIKISVFLEGTYAK